MELVVLEQRGSYGMPRTRMQSIIELLVYVSSTYRYMNPYFKSLHLKLGIWMIYRDEEGWRLRGEELKMAEVEGKWEGIEEADKTILGMVVPRLKLD